MISVELCDCHPVKVYLGFFRILSDYAYEKLLEVAPFGRICMQLTRPLKGYHDHGWYFLAFGRVVCFTPFRVKADEV